MPAPSPRTRRAAPWVALTCLLAAGCAAAPSEEEVASADEQAIVQTCSLAGLGPEVTAAWPARFETRRRGRFFDGDPFTIEVHPYCGRDARGALVPSCGEVVLAPSACGKPGAARGCTAAEVAESEPSGYRVPAVSFGKPTADGSQTITIRTSRAGADGKPAFATATYEYRAYASALLLRRPGEACWAKMTRLSPE
ncbi:MAG: hypothetical protein JNL38_36915 [Myxococcales bacterium]|nr:hypothetical protein [Myxococcales bacterium]